MAVFWHSVLLATAAVLAAGAGLRGAAIAAGVGAAACLVGRGASGAVRAVAFLAAVVTVVAAGLQFEQLGAVVLVYAALLAVQLGALGAAAAESEGAGPLWSTLAFYSGLVTAFLFLSTGGGWALLAASLAVAAGLMAWRAARAAKRFRETGGGPVGWRGLLANGLGFALLLAALSGLFARPLPWVGERAVEAGAGARDLGADLLARWTGDEKRGKQQDSETGTSGTGSPDLDFGRSRELPKRARIEQSGETLVHLHIENRAAFERFVAGRQYLRSWVLEQYSGDLWEEPESDPAFIADSADGVEDGWVTLAPGEGIAHRVYLPDAGGAGLPALQNPLRFGLSFVIESAPDMYEAELRGAVFYDAVSAPKLLTDLDPGRLLPGKVERRHLSRSAGVKLGVLARQILDGRYGNGEGLVAIGDYLRENCRYATSVENPEGLPALENFLFGERVGWCDFFATAAVLLAREAGFPARMAYGFSGGQSFARDQVVSYRESDAHAWAEVFVEGEGWVVFDATPPGQGAARPAEPAGGGRPPELSGYRSAEEGDLAGKPEARERSGVPEWLGPALVVLGVLLVLGIAWRMFSKKSDDDPGGDRGDAGPDPAAPGYWKEFVRLCLEVGRPRGKGETLRETITGLREGGFGAEVLPELAAYHYAVRYEAEPRDKATEGALRRELKRLRKANEA